MHLILLFIIAFYLYLRIFLGQVRVYRKQALGYCCFCLTNGTVRDLADAFVTRIWCHFVFGLPLMRAGIMMRGEDAPDNGNIY